MSRTVTPTGHTPGNPSSPQAYVVSQYSSDEIRLPIEGSRPPPNTPASDFSISPRHAESALRMKQSRKPSNLNLVHFVDLRAVTYETVVDENLVCPICHCPLVDPV